MFSKARIPLASMVISAALPGWAQRAAYRRRGYRIASDVRFAPGVVIEGEEVEIGAGASFGVGTVIRGRRIRIGRRASVGSFCFFDGRDLDIGDDTVVREQVFVGGPLFADSVLTLGKRVRVFQNCFLNPSRPLYIGDDTGLGGRSSIFTHGSWQSAFEGYPVTFEPVTIGRNVWLPWHVFILPGVNIGDGATIGAGAVVNRSVPAGALAAGVPAKVLRDAAHWPPPIGDHERWQIATEMLDAFASMLSDRGLDCVRESGSEFERLVFEHAGRQRRVTLRASLSLEPNDDVVVTLAGGPRHESMGATQWFDLGSHRKAGRLDEVGLEVEEWLNRWGVRFVPVTEG